MKPVLKAAALLLVIAGIFGLMGFVYLMNTGLSARDTPGSLETAVALRARNLTIGWHASGVKDPTSSTPETVSAGLEHFADHCATCHANDGSGNTDLGRGLFPKPPDMRLARTQDLSDGELFYIIENGIRFTGMPAFGTGQVSEKSATWPLVHFIRHLSKLSADELALMETLNPKAPGDMQQRMTEEQFLQGTDAASTIPAAPRTAHKGHK